MSNAGSDRLANASTDANGDSHVYADSDRRFRKNRGLNTLGNVIWRKKSLMFKHYLYESNKVDANDETPEDSNIEIPNVSTP